MKIVEAWPPNIDDIDAVLGVRARAAKTAFRPCFCYGDTIYNPFGSQIYPPTIRHEETHAEQTRAIGGPEKWWSVYLHDIDSRFVFELEAHRAEYGRVCEDYPTSRPLRRRALDEIAKRLISPAYGWRVRVSLEDAKREIKRAGI